jgi:hypothetical protein
LAPGTTGKYGKDEEMVCGVFGGGVAQREMRRSLVLTDDRYRYWVFRAGVGAQQMMFVVAGR